MPSVLVHLDIPVAVSNSLTASKPVASHRHIDECFRKRTTTHLRFNTNGTKCGRQTDNICFRHTNLRTCPQLIALPCLQYLLQLFAKGYSPNQQLPKPEITKLILVHSCYVRETCQRLSASSVGLS